VVEDGAVVIEVRTAGRRLGEIKLIRRQSDSVDPNAVVADRRAPFFAEIPIGIHAHIAHESPLGFAGIGHANIDARRIDQSLVFLGIVAEAAGLAGDVPAEVTLAPARAEPELTAV